jgi:hypothetical protein
METILDAIDLLPMEVVKQEVIAIAISKAQPDQPVSAKKLASKLLGKIASKLDCRTTKMEIVPTVLNLFKDSEGAIRHCVCQQFHLLARGLGSAETEEILLPLIVELSSDANAKLRLAALESAVQVSTFFLRHFGSGQKIKQWCFRLQPFPA